MMYKEWGFAGNPFDHNPLPASEIGERLLVGRDKAITDLKKRIRNGPKVATVEGLNGIGKTSVANVASYQLEQESISGTTNCLFIPCKTIFQITPRQTSGEFKTHVLAEIAQTLIDRRGDLPVEPGMTRASSNKVLDRYLNSPESTAIQGGMFGASIGYSTTTTPSRGFEKSGFEKAVLDWLQKLFPSSDNGGVVCIIDNLELMETSREAANLVEELRDVLFSAPGIRWILCGARGIVHGVASSPRLAGYLHRPIEIRDVERSHAYDIFQRRLNAYSERDDAAVPITKNDFLSLFELYRGNLRSVLDGMDDYCHFVDDSFEDVGDVVAHIDFPDWLEELAHETFNAVSKVASEEDLRVLAYSCSHGESFRYDDFRQFGFETRDPFAACVDRLIHWGVVWCIEEDGDHNRKLHRIAPKGWLAEKSGGLKRFSGLIHKVSPVMPSDDDWFLDGQKWSGETSSDDDE